VAQIRWRGEGGIPARVAKLGGERLTALLRVIAVPVLLVGVIYVPTPEASDSRFLVVLAIFGAYAVATVVIADRLDERWYTGFVALDVVFAGALSYASGGGYSQLRLAFLFPIVTAAFRCRPRLTIAVTAAAILVYLLQALSHPSAKSRLDSTSFIAAQMVYLAWIGIALSALSLLLARRERVVRTLVAEVFQAEERERRRLAEDLHDNAIQNLLAARRELEPAAIADPHGREGRAIESIVETLGQLRSEVSSLHPHLLDHVGIAVAIANAAENASARSHFTLALDTDRAEPGPNDRVLLRSASELLANIERHAGAGHVTVRLARDENFDVLTIIDDGAGFDPGAVAATVRPGHIGLLSLRERCEGLGGSLRIDARRGAGTTVTLRLPCKPAAEARELLSP
jgi:two-component system NarL family sensor kinase